MSDKVNDLARAIDEIVAVNSENKIVPRSLLVDLATSIRTRVQTSEHVGDGEPGHACIIRTLRYCYRVPSR